MTAEKKYKRIILKLSGEAMAGEKGFGIDPTVVYSLAKQIKEVVEHGVEVAVVNGGGNIWRGLSGYNKGMDRATADYMGMLATVINSLALSDALDASVPVRLGIVFIHQVIGFILGLPDGAQKRFALLFHKVSAPPHRRI